jgi:cell division septal protein FtsQ
LKTINQTYRDEYKSKKQRRLVTILLVVFLIISAMAGGTYYALFWSQWLAIRNLEVSQGSFISSDAIKQTVNDYLSEKSFFVPRSHSIFLIDSQKIRTLLVERFPVLKNITVKKKYLHGLIIRADYREAIGIWCFKKQDSCFYFDHEGVAFDNATESSGTLFLMVKDYTGFLEALGRPVASPERLAWIRELQKEMTKTKVGLASAIIPEELFRVNVKTTEGWEIYLSTNELLSPQIKALTIFLANKISLEQRSQLQYIDVRIPQRIYYKFTNPYPTN